MNSFSESVWIDDMSLGIRTELILQICLKDTIKLHFQFSISRMFVFIESQSQLTIHVTNFKSPDPHFSFLWVLFIICIFKLALYLSWKINVKPLWNKCGQINQLICLCAAKIQAYKLFYSSFIISDGEPKSPVHFSSAPT